MAWSIVAPCAGCSAEAVWAAVACVVQILGASQKVQNICVIFGPNCVIFGKLCQIWSRHENGVSYLVSEKAPVSDLVFPQLKLEKNSLIS